MLLSTIDDRRQGASQQVILLCVSSLSVRPPVCECYMLGDAGAMMPATPSGLL